MTKDPISGLVEFAQDVKPYHTKIIEILVDYIYGETMNVDVKDTHEIMACLQFDTAIQDRVPVWDEDRQKYMCTDIGEYKNDSMYCPDGYDTNGWGDIYKKKIDTTIDNAVVTNGSYVFGIVGIVSPNVLLLAGDQTSRLSDGSLLNISNSFNNDGTWKVVGVPSLTTMKSRDLPYINPTTDPDQPDVPAHVIRSEYYIENDVPVTRVEVEYTSNQLTLKMFAAYTAAWFPNGFLWINPTNPVPTARAKVYAGGAWVNFSLLYPLPTDPSFTFSTTQPVSVNTGSYWYNTSTSKLKQFDGTVWNVISSVNYLVGTSDDTIRANKNVMYLTGQAGNYFGVGQTFELKNSSHFHDGKWLVTKMCDDVFFSELTVLHVTNTTADGKIYLDVTDDPTPHWPTGLYWYDTTTSTLKIWDGGNWVPPPYTYTVSEIQPTLNIFTNSLWYVPSTGILSEYTGTAWVRVDEDYVVTGPVPTPDEHGPRYGVDGPIVASLTPSYNIVRVRKVTQPTVLNNEYGATENSCITSANVPDPASPSATFSIRGERTAEFSIGQRFIIKGSTGNDGVWKVYDFEYDIITNTTLITSVYEQISTINDTTTGQPNELFLTWDAVYGFGLGGIDLDLPLTSGDIETYTMSNFDFPDLCSSTSPTTASTKIKEHIDIDVSLPLYPIATIVSARTTTVSTPGMFSVKKFVNDEKSNQFLLKQFPSGAAFTITDSGNDNGTWTVFSSSYDSLLNRVDVVVVESIPRFPELGTLALPPYGTVNSEQAVIKETLSVEVSENTSPAAWEFYYYVAPTSPIDSFNTVSNIVNVRGDQRRFFDVGSKLTIQQSRRATVNYPFFEEVNVGSWAWTVVSRSYNSTHDITHIYVDKQLTHAPLQHGYVSGQPTWLKGVGWDQTGWSEESKPWMSVVDQQLMSGNDLTLLTNYDMFVNSIDSFDRNYFDVGRFDDVMQQILPL